MRRQGAMMNEMEMNRPVSFPNWREALASAAELSPERQDAFRHATMGYLHHLKERYARFRWPRPRHTSTRKGKRAAAARRLGR